MSSSTVLGVVFLAGCYSRSCGVECGGGAEAIIVAEVADSDPTCRSVSFAQGGCVRLVRSMLRWWLPLIRRL